MTKELISNIIERYISGKWAVFNFEIIEMVHEREVRTIRGPIPAGYDVNKVKKYEHIRDTKEIGKKLKDDFKLVNIGMNTNTCNVKNIIVSKNVRDGLDFGAGLPAS